MQVQVQSIIFGKELHTPLPRGVEDALFYPARRWAIFEIGDEYAVGTPIEQLDYSEYSQPPAQWDYDRPLPKPAGEWKYVFARFPTHEQAQGFFDMLKSFSDEGISKFYSQYYDAETGEYKLPYELELELDKERLNIEASDTNDVDALILRRELRAKLTEIGMTFDEFVANLVSKLGKLGSQPSG